MNFEEAKKIIKEQSKQLDHNQRFNAQTSTQEFLWVEAHAYLEGYEQAVKKCAEVAKKKFLQSRHYYDSNDGARFMERVILDLLERNP